ncbi:hypothetical protein RHGRI_018329 [Rhododendron griersonianum]|uniref:Uncharacterized protein n=1 Tax=Rhododendron griersonianum TaxID=479676 RepID=A0AAV6K113_9ERIC|nr:hypothetical protein RHGRI_018329 [Rhododendron griersonianum]
MVTFGYSHRARNTILSLVNDTGDRLEDPAAIESEIIGYYQRLLGTGFAQKTDPHDVLSVAIVQKVLELAGNAQTTQPHRNYRISMLSKKRAKRAERRPGKPPGISVKELSGEKKNLTMYTTNRTQYKKFGEISKQSTNFKRQNRTTDHISVAALSIERLQEYERTRIQRNQEIEYQL